MRSSVSALRFGAINLAAMLVAWLVGRELTPHMPIESRYVRTLAVTGIIAVVWVPIFLVIWRQEQRRKN
jgi:hypothetical protein